MKRCLALKAAAAAVAGAWALTSASLVLAADTIKVGVLHSLSGTMAISETALRNTARQNARQERALEVVQNDPFVQTLVREFMSRHNHHD